MRAFYGGVWLAGRPFAGGGGITILSYHSIDDEGTPLSVSPARFEEQMSALASEGCRTLTMGQVERHLREGKVFPRRAVAVTFDDGFRNVLEWALPAMSRHGYTATMYAITGMVGRVTRWTDRGAPLPSLPLLSWDDLGRLQAEGWEIGAHSITHGFLTTYADDALREELERPREEIRRQLGTAPGSLAYPQGDYDERVVAATRRTGYSTAVTVDQGRAAMGSDVLRLPRLLVSNNTGGAIVRAFVSPTAGPAYALVNLVVKRLLGKPNWPRRKPGEVDSTGSLAPEPEPDLEHARASATR